MEVEVTPRSLRSLLESFNKGSILLPQFQRSFVWKSRQIRNLLDSLLREYPIGAFYLWRPPVNSMGARLRPGAPVSPHFSGYLVDGQQRLTSLEAAYSLYEGEDEGHSALHCYLDLAAIDDGRGRVTRLFQTYSSNRATARRVDEGDVTLVPLDRIFQGADADYRDEIRSALEHLQWSSAEIGESLKRLDQAFRMLDQTVPCITMHDIGDHDAIEVFGRLNKGGRSLMQSDVRAAELARGHAVDVLQEMRDFVGEDSIRLKGLGFSFAFRALVVFHRGSAQFQSLKPEWVQAPSANSGSLRDSWRQAAKSLRDALSFVDNEMGWSRRALIPSVNAMIVLAYAMSKEKGKRTSDAEQLYKQWLCLTALAGTFQGSVETTMDRFIRPLKGALDTPAAILEKALKRDERQALTSETFFEYASPWGAHTQVMIAWLTSNGASDWISGISLDKLGRSGERHKPGGDLAVHHIFPRKLLAEFYDNPAEANIAANFALIGSPTNSEIGDRPPREVLDGMTVEQRERAAAQFVSHDAGDRLTPAKYEDFCEWRAEKLAEAINHWLGLDKKKSHR